MRSLGLATAVAFSVLIPSTAFGQAAATGLSITNYQFVSEQRVSLTKSNVTYRADLVNTDGALASVTATLTSLNPNSFTVVTGQGTLNFAPVPANSQTTSSNTFMILVDRTVAFNPTFSDLQWAFQTTSLAPVANAGPNQLATVGKTVTLDGSGSTNPSGIGTLTYSWAFTSRPPGSTATLANPTSVMPAFVPDVAGSYMITLTVSNGQASSSASVTVSTTAPPAPVANAGPNQSVTVGATVVLNGSGSTSGSGNPLTYAWTLTARPAGSMATLTGANTVSPTFVADKAGNYTAQLIVNDGVASSAPSTVMISTSCVKPVAKAAAASQLVNINAVVQLNGSGSTDACGLPLTYQWSLISKPAGSAAVLSNPTLVNPTFTADQSGDYVAQLIVNNGTLNSDPSTVMITTNPIIAPTANAGPNQTVTGGSTVQLNGSGTDPQNLPLTFKWTLNSKPAGSAAVLSSTVIPNPTFVADLAGAYVLQLIVNNGFKDSAPSTVTINTTCSQPTANPGPNQNVIVGATVTLNGSASGDACHDPLTYAWSFTTRPAGSNATLSGANTVSPTFVADVVGPYVVQLIVNNGFTASNPATVMITAGGLPTIALTPNPLSVTTITPGTLTVTLSSAAGAGGQVINLASSNTSIATVPATVTVAANATSTTVQVTGVTVGTATITGSAANFTSGMATVNVVSPAISVPPNTTIGLGLSATFAVTLSQAAPTGGVTVTLTSSDTSKVTVPASVFIAGGATAPATQPQVTGAGIGVATVTASATGFTSGSGMVTVSAPTMSFTGSPLAIIVGATGNLTLNLINGQAPAGGLTVNLTSDTPGVATVPATVSFAAGATSVTVPVTGVAMGSATIAASATGIASATATVNVTSVLINVPSSTTVGLGLSATFAVTLSQAAPTGGVTVTLTSSDTSKVTVTASVFIAGGATTPATQPQVTGAGIGSATVTASATGFTSGSGTVTVTAPAMSFTGSPLSINVGATGNLTLNLSGGQAPAGGLTVNLSSSDTSKATVPATVSFAAGATSVTVTVTGVAGGTATITASATGIASATATVNVAMTTIGVPATTTVGLGQSATFAVTLSQAAPTGGVTVNLSSSDTSKVTVPASVFIAGGATTPATQPQVTGAGIGSATITASATGYTSGSGTVTVSATLNFTGPLSITVGTTGNLTLNLAGGQAPAGGLTVNLSSSDTNTVTAPATVNFAAGATSVPVTVTGVAVGGPVTITASATGFANATTTVTVTPLPSINVPATTTVGLGLSATFAVTLSQIAPADVTVTLTSSDTNKVTVPSSVVILKGATTPATQPQVTGAGIGSATVTATASGYNSGSGTVTVTPPTLSFSPTTLNINASATGTLTLNLTGGQAPAGGLTVNLSSSSTSVATVPVSVTFAAGATSVPVTVTGVAMGSATISTSAPGILSATATVNVTGGFINVPANTIVNLGQSATFAVSLSQPAPTGGVTVTLTSSDTSKVTVPASVFIAGSATTPAVQPQVTGAGIGSATVTASAPSFTSGSGMVIVGAPTMSFAGSPLSIIVGATGNLTLNLTNGQAPAGGLTVNLSSSNTSVATVPASVTFAAGATSVPVPVTGVAVGGPVTITASATGITSATATVNVTQPGAIIVPATSTVLLGQTTTFMVSLSQAAPAGGLIVTLASSDSSKVKISPVTISFAAGATTPPMQPQVTGAGIGSATITASGANFTSGTGMVTVPAPTLSFVENPLSLNAGTQGNLTLTLSNGQAPAGGLLVNLISSNNGIATVPGTVTFLAGMATAVVKPVTGVSQGTAMITASAPGIAPATTTVNVGPMVSALIQPIVVPSVSVGQNLQTSITIQLLTMMSCDPNDPMVKPGTCKPAGPGGVFVIVDPATGIPVLFPAPAPAGGLIVSVTSSDPTKLLIASNALCPGIPLVCGSQQVKFGIPANLNTASGIYLQGMASSGTVTITASALNFPTGQATVTLTPSGFLLSGPGGGSSFTTNAGAASTPLTVSSSRLDSSLNPAEPQQVRAGYNDPINGPFDDAQGSITCNAMFTDPSLIQQCEDSRKYAFVNLSGLFTASVAVTSSNPAVGTVPAPAVFNGGDGSATAQFKPDATNTGTTTLTAVAPAGFSTPASGNTVMATVAAAGISCGAVTVGQHLETTVSCIFQGGSPSAGLPVTIASGDSSKLLLSTLTGTTCTDAGSPSITVNTTSPPGRPDLFFIPNFCVYGLVTSGTVNYTATASGFGTSNGSVKLAPSGFVIAGPGGIGAPSFVVQGSTATITVSSALLDSSFNFVAVQPLAIGQSANVTVTSSHPAVGTVNPAVIMFTGGSSSNTTTLTTGTGSSTSCIGNPIPIAGPCTELDVVQPAGFSTPATITGSAPAPTGVVAMVSLKGFSLTCDSIIGKDLEATCTVGIGQPAPAGGQPVTLTSSNSSLLLLSGTASGAGSPTLPLTIPAGSTSITYYAQGLASMGTVSHTASAAGFTPATSTATLAPSGVVIAGPFGLGSPFFTTSLTAPPPLVTVFLDVLNNSAAGCPPPPGGPPCATSTTQKLRGGLPSLSVSLTSSDPSVGTIASPVTIVAGSDNAVAQFTPQKSGSTTLSLVVPVTGFTTSTNDTTVTAQVTAPIIVPANTTVGVGMSTTFAVTLSQAAPAGGVTVTLTSSDTMTVTAPASVFIAAGAKTPATQPQVTGVAMGSATVTASAPGYTSGTGTVTVQ